MEICHFFVIFYDFVMKCVYKSTIYTFVIRDKIWTPPLCCTKVYMLLLCFGSRKHPPHPIHVRHFCVSPPPPPRTVQYCFFDYSIPEFCGLKNKNFLAINSWYQFLGNI